jgi:hypothetical protein
MTNLTAIGAKASGRNVEIGARDVRISATISGTFADLKGFTFRDGKHAPAILVVVMPQGSTKDIVNTRFDQSNSDGSFEFRSIPPGNYIIFALENAWDLDWENQDFLANFISKGLTVVAQPGREFTFDLTALNSHAGGPSN